MRKILLMMVFGFMLLFASIDLNTATKSELMSIKGIGEKKAQKILEYRKTNKILNVNDLQSLKGFGPALIKNIKESVETQ